MWVMHFTQNICDIEVYDISTYVTAHGSNLVNSWQPHNSCETSIVWSLWIWFVYSLDLIWMFLIVSKSGITLA